MALNRTMLKSLIEKQFIDQQLTIAEPTATPAAVLAIWPNRPGWPEGTVATGAAGRVAGTGAAGLEVAIEREGGDEDDEDL